MQRAVLGSKQGIGILPQFIFVTGFLSIDTEVSLQVPQLSNMMRSTQPAGMPMHLFGMMAVFLGLMLIISSRDLARRGSVVVLEGVLRLFGAGLMIGYGVIGTGGASALGGGVFDLVIGLIYLIGVPRHPGVGLAALILDQPLAHRT